MTLDELFDRGVVAELDLRSPLTVATGTPIGETVERMRARRTAVALIVDGGRVVGLFTEVDFVRRVLGEGVALASSIDDHMTRSPSTVKRETRLSECLALMSDGDFRHLPVVDDAGRPTHILAIRHLTQYLAERYPAEILAMAPNIHQIAEVDGG